MKTKKTTASDARRLIVDRTNRRQKMSFREINPDDAVHGEFREGENQPPGFLGGRCNSDRIRRFGSDKFDPFDFPSLRQHEIDLNP